MVKKIYFPREVLPLSFTLSQFINMLLSFIVIFVVVFISGVEQNPKALLLLPLTMLIEFVLSLGVTFLGAKVLFPIPLIMRSSAYTRYYFDGMDVCYTDIISLRYGAGKSAQFFLVESHDICDDCLQGYIILR